MDFSKLEKLMYEDEEFLEWLEILVEENWKAATPRERMGFFTQLERLVNKVDETFPLDIIAVELDPQEDQNIIFYDDSVYMDKRLVTRKINPYEIITNYFFELAIVNYVMLSTNEEFAKTELGKKICLNLDSSLLGDWTNYFDRRSENFFVQPLIRESSNIARRLAYNLLKYMDENYGMDKYIGSKISNLMISSFRNQKMQEDTDKNFLEMEARSLKKVQEKEDLIKLQKYLENVKWDELSDDEFYALYNEKILNVLETEAVGGLFSKYVQRELKGFSKIKDVLGNYALGEDEENGLYIDINNLRIFVKNYSQAFDNLIISLNNIKLAEGLDTGIDDEEFLNNARTCYEYIIEVMNDSAQFECDYLANAFSYYEYKNMMIAKSYNKIKEAIKKSDMFKDGKPCMSNADFSKYEAYLNFTFSKTYEEVKKEQFEKLEKQYRDIKRGVK